MNFNHEEIESHRRNARRIFILSGVFLLSLLLLPWTQTVIGKGKVVAYSPTEREQRIIAPIEGRVKQWFVAEGSIVNKGDPIVELTDVDPDILVKLRSEQTATQKKLEAAKIGIKTSRLNV